jgi:serine/threonine protein kinase
MSNITPGNVPENLEWDHEKNLKYVNKRYDIRFGDIVIYKDETTQRKVLKKEKKSGDKNKLAQDVMLAQERMKLQSGFIQKMLGWSVATEKGLCSTNHFVNMFFDYPTTDLRNEVADRNKKKLGMTDGELSNIVSNSLRGLDFIHSRGLAHGDIRPELIGCEKDKGSKSISHSNLLDRLVDQSSIEKAQTNRLINKKQLYMSPQLYKLINTKGKKKPIYNRQKNDLFALGMTVLSAGNKKSLNNCYVKGGDFNVDKLNEHLDQFNQRYSRNPNLCRVVSDLVQVDESMRPDPSFLARQPQVVYQEPIDLENLNQEEEVKNTFYKRAEVGVNNAPPVESTQPYPTESVQPHPLDHEEHYVKPGEEVVYGEPKVVRTYIDEKSRRKDKGQNQAEIVRLKNAYDPNKHDVEPEVNTQYTSVPPMNVYKKQAPPTYVSNRPAQTYNPPTTTYVSSTPAQTYNPPTTTYVSSTPSQAYDQPTTTYVNSTPAQTYNQPTTTYVNSTPAQTYNQPTTTYTYKQPTTTYVEPEETYVQASPAYLPPAPKENKPKNLEYVVSERKAVEFHNLKFDNVNQSETEPENRFEEPVKSRVAEKGEDMESFPPEGKVVRKRVKIKNAEGEVIEEYDEPVK